MTDSEWSANMRRVLGPHLAAMSNEVTREWGDDVDPEIMLLRWLCSRHNLEQPPASIRRSEKTKGPDTLPRPYGSEAPPTPKSRAPPRDTQTPQSARLPAATPPGTARSGHTSGSSAPLLPKVPLSARLPGVTPPLPEAQLTAQQLDLGLAATWPQKPKSKLLCLQSGEVTPWSRTLNNVVEQIEHDAVRHQTRSDHLKANNERMAMEIALMNQGVRGQFLAKVPLLSAQVLTEQTQLRLVSCLRPHTFEKGESIFTEDEVGDKLYIVERGICEVLKKTNGREMTVGQLGKGAFFGEIAVLYDMPRTSTVRAASQVVCLSLSRHDINAQLSAEDIDRMRLIARTQVFSEIPLLSRLSPEQKARVAEKLKSQRWYKGAVLAGQNHITSQIYIVEQGTLLMEVSDRTMLPSFMQEFGGTIRLGPGQYFGMRGLLYGAPHGFNITAASEEVYTLSISYEDLLDCGGDARERQEMEKIMRGSMQSYLLRQIPQLKTLADTSFAAVEAHAEEVSFKKWSVVFAKGAPIESVFVLESGKLVEYDGEADKLQELSGMDVNCPERVTPGEFWGTECLTHQKAVAPCTLVALTDVKMLRLPPSAVWVVQQEQRHFISQIPLFAQDVLSQDEQYMLVSKLKPWNFPAGRHIMTEGEIGDMLYIIESGVCDALKTIDGQEVVLSQLKKGAFFGELAVVFDMPRTASMRATTNVVALSLSREDIMSVIGEEKIKKMRVIARAQVFGGIALLASLSATAKNTVARRLKSETWKPGQTIVDFERHTDRLFVIEKGQALIYSDESAQAALLPAGMTFGMPGLLYAQPFGIKVTAGPEKVKTLSLSLEDIYAAAGMGEHEAFERNLQKEFRLWLLKQFGPLKGKAEDYYSAVLNHCEIMHFKKDATVFKAGDPLNSVYIVEHGSFVATPLQRAMTRIEGNLGAVAGAKITLHGTECLSSRATDNVPAPYTLVAKTDGTILRVPISIIRTAMKKDKKETS